MNIEAAKSTVRRAMSNYKGDDLERCRHAFAKFGPEEMKNYWGNSAMTCQEILDGYVLHRKEWEMAMEWLRSVGL